MNRIMIIINSMFATVSMFFSSYSIMMQFNGIPKVLVLSMPLIVSLFVFWAMMYINKTIEYFGKIENEQYDELGDIEYIIYALHLIKTKWSSLYDKEIKDKIIVSTYISPREYRKRINEVLNRLDADKNKGSQTF